MKTIKLLNIIFVVVLGFFAVMFGIDQFGTQTVTVNTSEYCQGDNFKGFNDVIPMEITIEDGKIAEIKILDNQETPPFLAKVTDAKLVEKFYGLTPQEAIDLEIDAVSGATYSSNAIIKSVKRTMESCSVEPAKSPWTWQLIGLICSAAILCVLSFFRRKY